MAIRDLMRWDKPFGVSIRQSDRFGRSLNRLQEEMNRLFEHIYAGTEVYLTDWDKKLLTSPSVNILEDGHSYKLEIELAGMDPEHVDIEVTDSYLTIKGEKQEEASGEDKNFLQREIAFGSFYRMIPMPDAADCRKAEASFRNGILSITVPKKAEAIQKPSKLQIKKAA